MFTETLKVKPKLDEGAAKNMEKSLSARFKNVSRKFSSGLKNMAKGSLLGITAGFLTKLLNPINDLEEKIKSMLEQTEDIKETSEKFGSTPGELRRLQDVGGALGVKPDQLNELISKFSGALDTARKEFADPEQKQSEASKAVSQFMNDENRVASFVQFMKGLRTLSADDQRKVQESVFGERQMGSAGRLFGADLDSEAKRIGEPGAKTLDRAYTKLSQLADQQRVSQIRSNTSDFLKSAGLMNSNMITDMENRRIRDQDTLTKQLSSYEDMAIAARGVQDGLDILKSGQKEFLNGVRAIVELKDFVTKELKASRLFKGFFKSSGE